MTDSEKELRRLAQEATPGPWEVSEDGDWDEAWCRWHKVGKLDLCGAKLNNDTRFIAAANPATVLALLDRIEALEKQVGEAERKGAEEMRDAARREAARERDSAEKQCSNDGARSAYWDARRAQAQTLEKWIAALPLPGDAQ